MQKPTELGNLLGQIIHEVITEQLSNNDGYLKDICREWLNDINLKSYIKDVNWSHYLYYPEIVRAIDNSDLAENLAEVMDNKLAKLQEIVDNQTRQIESLRLQLEAKPQRSFSFLWGK